MPLLGSCAHYTFFVPHFNLMLKSREVYPGYTVHCQRLIVLIIRCIFIVFLVSILFFLTMMSELNLLNNFKVFACLSNLANMCYSH